MPSTDSFTALETIAKPGFAREVRARLEPCANCDGEEHVEIFYRVLARYWSIRCECGSETLTHSDWRRVVRRWNRMQRDARKRLRWLRECTR